MIRSVLLFFLLIAGVLQAQTVDNNPFLNTNTPYDEQNPVISPDGKTLFFTIANDPQNMGGKKDLGDIWMAVRVGNSWSAPVNAGNVLNDKHYNAVGGMSADGRELFLLSHYREDGEVRSQGIAVSRKTGGGWSTPQNLIIPYFLNRSSTLTGHISGNGSIFVFSAESYNTLGAEDIYVTHRLSDGSWSEPKNLGRNINTSFQELSPWLSEDNEYLYFASNGRQSYGSFDVYYSRRLDDTWTRWSAPVNMGAAVNTEGRELFYHPYPKDGFALYTSTLNSDGYGDIKQYWPPKEVQDSLMQVAMQTAVDTVVKIVEIQREKPITSDEKRVKIFGKVTDMKTSSPIKAAIHFKSDSSFSIAAGTDGTFEVMVPSVNEYGIEVDAPGYISNFEKLDIRTFEMKELEMNFKLQAAEVGATVNLKNVLFQQSTANLLDESYDELNAVVEFMKTNPNVEIELAGHTDNRGIHALNVKLSQERVDKVKSYLVEKGISTKRISGKGYGGIKPIAANDSEESRRLNRRVEFTIVKN